VTGGTWRKHTIRIQYSVTPDDVSNVYKYDWEHSPRFRYTVLIFAGLLALIFLAIRFLVAGSVSVADFIAALLISIVWLFLSPRLSRLQTKKQTRIMQVDDKGIYSEIGKMRGSVSWSQILKIDVTDEFVIITRKNLNSFVVSQRAFADAAARGHFIEYCQQSLTAPKELETLGNLI
jgi:hypothetical protein